MGIFSQPLTQAIVEMDQMTNTNQQSGGIVLRILIAVATLLIIGGTIVVILSRDQEKQQTYHRKAMAISEYGLQQALQRLYDEPSWSGTIAKTPYNGGWYKVELQREKIADTLFLTIISEGHLKSASDKKKCVLNLEVGQGDSVWVRRSMQ